MRIFVTERDKIQASLDIAAGKPRCYHCPVAQSLRRRGFQWVRVGVHEITWRHKGQFRRAKTPEPVAQWVRNYDAGRYLVPFRFEFEGEP